MLRTSIGFFVLGLLALGLGAYDLGGVSLELGRILLFVFLGLAILTFLGGLMTKRRAGTARLLVSALLTASMLSHAFPNLFPPAHADSGLKPKGIGHSIAPCPPR